MRMAREAAAAPIAMPAVAPGLRVVEGVVGCESGADEVLDDD